MKHPIRRLVPAVCVALALGACASTDTKQSTGEYIDDTAISAKVKTALIEDSDTKARDIQVETYKGVVQLSGFVDSSSEKAEAERLAKQVAGVERVDNKLSVK
jgi:osmotically-inducible protein OsmY